MFRLLEERYGIAVAILVESRKDAGVTQADLAARLGKHQSYISKIERKERRADIVEFHDWAVALGLKPEALFDRLRLALK